MTDKKIVKLNFNSEGYAPAYTPFEDKRLSKQEVDQKLGLDKPRFIEFGPVKIFREGKWNGNPYSSEDILEMEMNFRVMKNTWTPTLKVSHEQGWHLADDESKEENYGYISKMYEDNGVVNAYFVVEIPFYVEKIAGRKLVTKSVEIWPEMEYNEKVYKNVISNVALLGTSMPGCGDLGSLEDENTTYRIFSKSDKGPLTYVVDEEGNGVMPDQKDLTPEVESEVTDQEELQSEELDNSELENQEPANEEAEEEPQADEESESEEDNGEAVDKDAEDQNEDEESEESSEAEEPEEPQSDQLELSKDEEEKLAFNKLKLSFEEQLKSMEARFTEQLEAQRNTIEEFRKERVETQIKYDLEDLIRDGHVAPANRELCKELFKSLESADKVCFRAGEKEINTASNLLKHLLKSYSVWQSDASIEGDDIQTELEQALPQEEASTTVNYRGKAYSVDYAEEDRMAKELKRKYAAEGKDKSYWDCYLEVVKNR